MPVLLDLGKNYARVTSPMKNLIMPVLQALGNNYARVTSPGNGEVGQVKRQPPQRRNLWVDEAQL